MEMSSRASNCFRPVLRSKPGSSWPSYSVAPGRWPSLPPVSARLACTWPAARVAPLAMLAQSLPNSASITSRPLLPGATLAITGRPRAAASTPNSANSESPAPAVRWAGSGGRSAQMPSGVPRASKTSSVSVSTRTESPWPGALPGARPAKLDVTSGLAIRSPGALLRRQGKGVWVGSFSARNTSPGVAGLAGGLLSLRIQTMSRSLRAPSVGVLRVPPRMSRPLRSVARRRKLPAAPG